MRARPSASSARRGSVIVVVLVMVMLASLMLVKFMETSEVELTLATRQADRDRLRPDAYSALETLLAVMAEIKSIDDDHLNAPEQGWGDPYAYAGESPREGVTVAYSFTDESGKTSLPSLKFEEMMELAQSLGLSEPDARRFADGLYTWMTADHMPQDIDAEASRYEQEDPPITVPKRPLRSWDELRSVRVARDYVYDEQGALTAFGAALRANVSLYEYKGVNVNSLAPGLGSARGWDSSQMEQIAGYRAGKSSRPAGAPTWFRGAEDLTAVLGANADVEGLDAEVKVMRVEVTVKEGAASMTLVALVALDDSVKLPDVANPSGGETAAGGQAAGAGAQAGGQTANGGRANTGANGGRAGNGNQGATGAAAEERLNYPFSLLELVETNNPPPVVLPEEEVLEVDTVTKL